MQASCVDQRVDRSHLSLSSEAKEVSTKPLITNHLDYSQPYLMKDWLAIDSENNELLNDELLNPISSDRASSEAVDKILVNAEYLQLITNHMLLDVAPTLDSNTETFSQPTAQSGFVYTDSPWTVSTAFAPTPLLPTVTAASKSSEVRRANTQNYVVTPPAPSVPRFTEAQLRAQRAAANKNYVMQANARIDAGREAREARAQRSAPPVDERPVSNVTLHEYSAAENAYGTVSDVGSNVYGMSNKAFADFKRRVGIETTKTRCSTQGRNRRVCRSGNVSKQKCKEAVNDILVKQGLLKKRIPGISAWMSHPWLETHGFDNIIKQVRSSGRAPIGAVLVYKDIDTRKNRSERHGHIEIRMGANKYCSDFCATRPIDKSNSKRVLVAVYVPDKWNKKR